MMIIVIRRNIDKVSGYPDIILVDKWYRAICVHKKSSAHSVQPLAGYRKHKYE